MVGFAKGFAQTGLYDNPNRINLDTFNERAQGDILYYLVTNELTNIGDPEIKQQVLGVCENFPFDEKKSGDYGRWGHMNQTQRTLELSLAGSSFTRNADDFHDEPSP